MKLDEIVELNIIDNGINGEGIAKMDGFTFFVPYSICGEKVTAKICKINKNLIDAKLIKVVEPCTDRILPICPYFEKCGGCDMQEIKYSLQLKIKQANLQTTLKKSIKNFELNVLPVIPSKQEFRYRNKIELPINNLKIGYFKPNSRDFFEIEDCQIFCEKLDKDILSPIRKFLLENVKNGENFKHLILRVIENQICVIFVLNKEINIFGYNELYNSLLNYYKGVSIYININKNNNTSILSNNCKLLIGNKAINCNIDGVKTEISPLSFLQINDDVRNKIYSFVKSNINNNSVVIDAYSGAGILSAILSKNSKYVYGIEIVKSATENANYLIENNGIKNVKNFNGNCKDIFPKILKNYQAQNLEIVIDPPRKGIDEATLKSINESGANKIIYISCNPATLARDINLLNKYNIESIQPFDMFPQTKHVESVTILTKIQ